MATVICVNFIKSWKICSLNFSTLGGLNNKWRLKQGLEFSPRRFGPLTNLPDYSFVDGRPVPLGLAKLSKIMLQRKYCERIAELSNEIDVGLKQYFENLEEKEKKEEEILKNMLKPKGLKLLKK